MQGAESARWRVVGFTSETPNYRPTVEAHLVNYQPIAQFTSVHAGGLTMFAFADGSTRTISDTIDLAVFHGMGTVNGRD